MPKDGAKKVIFEKGTVAFQLYFVFEVAIQMLLDWDQNKVHHERRPSIDSTDSSVYSIQEEQEDTWGHFVYI